MSSGSGCKVRGFREMRAQFAALTSKYPKAIARAAYEEAEFILANSKAGFVPVSHGGAQGGHLRNSGHTLPPKIEGRNVSVSIVFGGAAAPYALAVHEHLSQHSPPSWQNKSAEEINWSVPGTGPKYLEIPFRAALPGMMARIAQSVRDQVG